MATENKTQITNIEPRDFIATVEPPRRREDALVLLDMFARITGYEARMWGPTIIGYGSYHYKYESGREGDILASGFSPRKANMVLYGLPGNSEHGALLERLGKHRLGKSCLYINKLSDIDLTVLEEMITIGLADLSKQYPVSSGA